MFDGLSDSHERTDEQQGNILLWKNTRTVLIVSHATYPPTRAGRPELNSARAQHTSRR